MARKPKAAPSTEPELPVELAQPAPGDTATALRRGRMPKAAAPASEPASPGESEMTGTDPSPALSAMDTTPAKGRPGRKPKGWEEAAASSLLQEAMERQPEPGVDQPGAAADPAAAVDDARTAEMAYPVGSDENGDAPASGAPPPSLAQDTAPAARSAAQWDQATDTVRFDWAEIERTASQDGPNQAMAKLLVAARAEGANSRWPL